jgi:Putative auto-transporter adhesin, head GIN domain
MKSTFWSILTLSVVLFFTSSACTQNWNNGTGIKGEGPKVTKTLDLASFDGLKLAISADVMIRQGSPQSVKIEAQQNIIDNLKKEVKDGVWKIGFDKNVKDCESIKIWVTVPTVEELAVSGSGSIIGEGKFSNLNDLSLAISGSGDIKFDADSKNLSVAISGSGNMELAGSTGESTLAISGSGDIAAFGLSSRSCNVRISGSGDSSVNVSESLEVAIAGSGDVYYKGRPSVRSKVSGSGEVMSK